MDAAANQFSTLNRGQIGPVDHSDAYERMRMFSGMNMLICQVGVAAGDADNGDVMVVPFLQYDASTDLGSDDW
jgi:hypothetical protein